MGTIFVDNLEPQSGTSLTLGASGDTVTLTSGAKTSGFGKVGQVVTGTSNNNTQDVTLRVMIADTPNTTSQVNYKLYYKTTAGTVYLNLYGNTHTVKLTEILD